MDEIIHCSRARYRQHCPVQSCLGNLLVREPKSHFTCSYVVASNRWLTVTLIIRNNYWLLRHTHACHTHRHSTQIERHRRLARWINSCLPRGTHPVNQDVLMLFWNVCLWVVLTMPSRKTRYMKLDTVEENVAEDEEDEAPPARVQLHCRHSMSKVSIGIVL